MDRVGRRSTHRSTRRTAGRRSPAVSSIAEPEGFHEMVRSRASGVVECMAFPDHHPFSHKDICRIVERAAGRSVVITEKDAVKLRTFSQELPRTYVLRLQVAWDFGQDAVMALIRRAIDDKSLARGSGLSDVIA